MSTEATVADAAGLDLSSFRPDHVTRGIRDAAARERVPEAQLGRALRSDPVARERFRRAVAVSVSGLFRDTAQFALLEQTLLPPLLHDSRRLSVWSAGCSDGSELYSVALVLERMRALDGVVLLGSDLLEENLALARAGRYADETMPDDLRARLRWDRRDLVRDGAPARGWRLILCRNVAIYLSREARVRLERMLAEALSVGGVLLLGRSERLSNPGELGLESVAPHAYRRVS